MKVGDLKRYLADQKDEREVVVCINIDEGCTQHEVVAVEADDKTFQMYINLHGLTVEEIEKGRE